MAYIRVRDTKARTKGRPVRSYVVCWREPVRDDYGAIVLGKTVQRTETFTAERQAKARLREIETHLSSAKGDDPSSRQTKANAPLGVYAKQYLDSLAGAIDPTTIQGYEKLYRTHIAPAFGQRPVASITTADVTAFRAQLLAPYQQRSFVTRGKPSAATAKRKPATVQRSPKTVKHIVGTLKRILDVAVDDQAIPSNPVVAGRRTSTKRRASGDGRAPFKHRPLSSDEVAALHDRIAGERRNSVYALAVLFAAYTGVRASELQGLQVQDVTLSTLPATVGSIRVVRTAKRKGRVWNYGTPKSDASTDRVVPLAPWLADDLRHYLTTVHPFSAINAAGNKYIAHAPLFPGKRTRAGKAAADVEDFDWAKPIVADNLYHNYFQPATKALGLGPVRLHDLRHTFATLALSAGEHYMQVSKWLGHSSYVLTLTTYADYIPKDELAAPNLARPVANAPTNVVELQRRAAN